MLCTQLALRRRFVTVHVPALLIMDAAEERRKRLKLMAAQAADASDNPTSQRKY